MRKEKITRYEITKSNQRAIKNLVTMAVQPYLDAQNPEELKNYNILLFQEKYIFEDKMKKVLNFLADIKTRIKARRSDIESWSNDPLNPLPEKVENGLILRPQQFAKDRIENYDAQLRFIDEIITVLTVEDEYDPDDDEI